MLNKIRVKKLAPIISNKEKIQIINLKELVLRQCNHVDYGTEDMEAIVNIAREGFQFRPTVSSFIAIDQEKTVGIISGSTQRRSITALFVHPQYQKRGIAQRLLQHLEIEITDSGTKKDCIRLVCPPSSAKFFEKSGYIAIAKNIQSQGKVKVFLMRKYPSKNPALKTIKEDIILKYSYIAYTFISRIFA